MTKFTFLYTFSNLQTNYCFLLILILIVFISKLLYSSKLDYAIHFRFGKLLRIYLLVSDLLGSLF